MALQIVEQLCKSSGNSATVVMQGTIEELNSGDARSKAVLRGGQFGLNRPGISNQAGPYPVDAEGATDEDLVAGRRQGIAAYRKDFDVKGMP